MAEKKHIIIDNFDAIKKQLTFDDITKYYFIQVVKRSKDNPDMKSYMQVLRSFYVFTEEDYEHYKPVIKKLCKDNNARACIDFNRLDIDEVKNKAKEILDKYSSYGHQLNNKKWFRKLQYCFDDSSVIVSTSRKENPYLTVDVDEKNKVDEIYNSIFLKDKAIFTVPTVAGNHVIIRNYKERMPFFEHFKEVNVSIMDYCYVFLYCDIVTDAI